MKKIKFALAALMLAVSSVVSAQEISEHSICAPLNVDQIRSGVVGKDYWFYWWCQNSTTVWTIWQPMLDSELRAKAYENVLQQLSSPSKTFLRPSKFTGQGMNINTDLKYAHLYSAVLAAIAVDTNKPSPGVPAFVPGVLPEIWTVTANGPNPFRKTSIIVNGKAGPYGSGTLNVKVGKLCDCASFSIPEGSVTKMCPIKEETNAEVISCTRIQ